MPTKQKKSKKPQFIVDEKGKRVGVLLDLKTYKKLLDDIDELSCIVLFDEAKRDEPNYLPYDEAMKEIMMARKRKGLA